MQPTNSQEPENGETPAWLRPSKTAVIIQMILMAAIPMAIGIVAFCIIHRWDVEFQRKMEMIQCGEVKPETLSIITINREKGNPTGSIALGKDKTILVWRCEIPLEGMQIGDETTAYPFGEEYVIPRFDRGNFWGKWLFLAGGLLMTFLVCGGMLLYIPILSRSRRNVKSRAATESTAVPKAYSRSSMQFDHNPIDSELTCLLDAPRSLGMAGFKTIETGGVFRVIPTQLPIIGIVASMLPVAILFTVVPLFLEHPSSSGMFSLLYNVFLWCWIAFSWLLIPFVAVILAVVNHQIAKTDDFLRVDTTRRVLELCRVGRTLPAADIVAFTELTRWLRGEGVVGWVKTQQTGVLVRTANGGVELLVLADGMRRPRLADRLASIFQVPVRRIKLSQSESRALNDC